MSPRFVDEFRNVRDKGLATADSWRKRGGEREATFSVAVEACPALWSAGDMKAFLLRVAERDDCVVVRATFPRPRFEPPDGSFTALLRELADEGFTPLSASCCWSEGGECVMRVSLFCSVSITESVHFRQVQGPSR